MKRRVDMGRRGLVRAAAALPLAAGLGSLTAAGFLAGCSNLVPGQRPPPRFYRLSPKSTFDSDIPQVDWQLILEPPIANAALDTVRIALMREPMEVEYYARANWTDQAPQMLQTLIVESFENSRSIVSIGRESLGLRADYVLKSELREFQAEYFQPGPPMAHVAMNVKLVKMPRREIVANESFSSRAQATADTLPAVIAAFDDALGAVLRRMVEWSLRTGQQFYERPDS